MFVSYSFYPLAATLSAFESLTAAGLLLAVGILIYDLARKYSRKRKQEKMNQNLYYITHKKRKDLIEILTYQQNISEREIQARMQINLGCFDSKNKDLLYHELFKIRNFYQINPHNWDVLVGMIFQKKSYKPVYFTQ